MRRRAARQPSARNGLLIVQTALAVVLLVAATLTVRSFHAIQRVHLGFDPADLVTFDVLAPAGKYTKHETNNRFYRGVGAHLKPRITLSTA